MDPSEHEEDKVERLKRAMYSRSLSPKMEDRERRELSSTPHVVGDDFVHPEERIAGITVAPRTIGLARKGLWWILGIAVIFFIAALSFFGYYFLFGQGAGAASPSNIDISVSGPPQIAGGAPTELQVVVTNKNNIPLELADLVVTFPPGTRSPTDFSTPEPSLRQSLGTIEAGGQRQGTISAVFEGQSGQSADVKIELEYHIAGSNAIFVASSDYTALFSSSPLSIAVDSNNQTISGQPMQLIVNVSSNANAPVNDVLLQAQYPFGFTPSSASPAPSAGSTSSLGFWQLGAFAPGQSKSVTIQGTLSGAQGDNRVFHFTAGTRSVATSTTIDTSLADDTFQVSVTKPFLTLAPTVNGASDSTVVLAPAASVVVTVNWQNNLTTPITNAAIVAKLTGLQIDGSTLKSSTGVFRSTDGVVIWDKTTDPELATLAPGAHGVVSFSFQLPSGIDLTSVVNPKLDISINAAGNRVSETNVPENLQATADQKIAIASNVQLQAQGLYYSNPFGSSGPMPPKAGTETTYAVVFTVTNSTSVIKDATLTAQLPPYVRWTGICSPSSECDPSTGKLVFNGDTGTLTWNLGDIAANAGLNGTAPRQMVVSLGFTPSTSQIGQEPAILENIQLTGIDESKAQAELSANPGATITPTSLLTTPTPDVTTNILSDPGFSAANAEVVK